MYTSLDDYMASDFYKEPSKLVSVIINRKDLSVFKMEMSAYLHQRENSWKSAFLVVPELNAHSFKFTDNEDGTYRIDFPKDISRKEYLKYFKQTNEASLESNPSSDIELSEIKQPKNKWQSFSDSEKEKEKETESEELSSDSEEIPEEEELNSRGRVLASSMEKGEFQAERNPHLEEENTQDASDELRNPGVRPTP